MYISSLDNSVQVNFFYLVSDKANEWDWYSMAVEHIDTDILIVPHINEMVALEVGLISLDSPFGMRSNYRIFSMYWKFFRVTYIKHVGYSLYGYSSITNLNAKE